MTTGMTMGMGKMNLLPLLNVLPADIVHIIFLFIFQKECAYKIACSYKLYSDNRKILKRSMEHLVYHDSYDSVDGRKLSVICNSNIENLIYILSNYYSKKKYDIQFWQNYLSFLAYKLMHVWTRIHMYALDQNKNKCYTNFKKTVELWLCLCKKYNIELALFTRRSRSSYEFYTDYIYARNLIRIKNFNKFVGTPRVVCEDHYSFVINDNAFMYLYLRLLRGR